MKKKMNKKAFQNEMLGWWILGLVVLVMAIIIIILLRDKGTGAISYIKNLFGWS